MKPPILPHTIKCNTFPFVNNIRIIFSVDAMYSGEYDACDVTLSVYPHPASLKNMPGHCLQNACWTLWFGDCYRLCAFAKLR